MHTTKVNHQFAIDKHPNIIIASELKELVGCVIKLKFAMQFKCEVEIVIRHAG